MIQEAYCSCVVSKLLKEKGFQEPCTGLNKLLCKEGEKPVLRITHQKAMRWLREVHNIFIDIRRSLNTYFYGAIIRIDPSDKFYKITEQFETYEEAVEAALKYCLENLI